MRAYDAFVETLNFNELKLHLDAHKVGCPEYNPKAMLKLLLYGYSYGFRSSRKLERATYHNVSFIWLMGGLKPDHKTIAEFRRKNKASLKDVLKTCARLCIKLNLIAGNTLFVDGSKVRANASIKNTWTKEKCQRALGYIDTRIEAILSECDTACADSGYANTRELEKIDKQKIKVIIPSQKQASGKKPKPFDKSNFQYDSQKDSYLCPEGHVLTCSYTNNYEGHKVYMMQEKAELPFGHIKRNLKVDAFLLRGRDGAKAEASLLASCLASNG